MNNEFYSTRFGVRGKVASVVLTASMLASSFTGLGATLVPTVTVEAANSYGLATKIEDGNILHCFDWPISDITAEMENIAKAGFTSVQTSPLQPHDASGTWYWLYQPIGFSVGNDLGSKEDLKALCAEADKYGVKVIVDVVANHVAGWADGRRKDYIQNGLTKDEYFHNTQYNTEAKNVDWGNRWQVTHCNIGMPDLNSEHSYVQQVVAGLVNELKECGVDGIRWDAAKHIGLPSEDCNFWPAVTAAGLYNYGEILDGPTNSGGDNLMVEYTKYIGVTDDNYSGEITGAIRDGKVTTNTGKWANRGVSQSKIVYWPESHDTYCNNGWTNGLSEDVMDRAFAVSGARADCQTLYLSRPFEKQHTAIAYNVKGSTHFTSAQVAAVNHFHNAMVGTKEYFTTGDNCFVICRGGGAVVVNAGGGSKTVTVPNGGGLVPAGTYTDEITGNTWTVTSSTMSGQIGNTGIAVFYKGGAPIGGGSVLASPASGTSFTDTLSVTLTASDATNLTYSTSEGASGAFTSGQKITVGSSTAVGGTVTVTVKGTGSDGSALSETYKYTKKDPNATTCIYFDNSSYNWSSVYAYVYTGDGASAKNMGAWPGVKLTEKNSKGYFKLDVSGFENGRAIFNDGTGSATNRYPADQEPGMQIGGSSKLFSANHKWEDYSDVVIPVPKDPDVTVDKASGTSFTTETFDITLSLSNATSGTYSIDNGPEKKFTTTTKVTIGEGKIADTDVTVKVTATDGSKTTNKTLTYTKKYVKKTTSTSASALTGKYATNPKGQLGGKGVTIKSASDFKDSMIIAQGVANDDPRIFRGSHEAPVYDTYALYAAWDDTNLYLGWQFTNVTDVVDPAQGYPISDNGKPWNGDIPQMIAFNLGKGKTADMSKGTLASGYVWGLKVGFETKIDALMCFSSKPKVGKPALFKTDSSGYFNYDYTEGVIDFTAGGISFNYEDGFFGSSITGIKKNGYEGYKPADLTSSASEWVDFLSLGHDKAQDTFYTMTIPLATLGITRSYLESNGIGVMHISTFGEGGISSTPMDMTFLDNATEPYTADESTSQEKADTDLVTVPLARIGAGGGDTPIDPDDPDPVTTPLQVNFGTDRSAPQLSTTALTIKGIGYGGTAPYKYEFSVDGKVIKASNTTATVSWTPTTAGQHTLKCVITDSTGKTATATKTFTSEGGDIIIIDPDELINSSSLSSTSISLGSAVTFKGSASGGTAPYTYAYYYKSSSASSWTTVKAYSSTTSVSATPSSAGSYQACIKVKDSTGTEVKKYIDFTVNGSGVVNNSTVSATTVTLGNAVTVKGAASGGTSPYKYAVLYKASSTSTWTTKQDFSTNASVSITFTGTGTKDICVKVKDNAGNIAKKYFTVTVKVAALTNNSTVSATSIALGSTIKATAKATGGTAPYTYQIVYKKSTQSNWQTASAYSTTATANIKPASTGAYQICIKVKDKTGTEVKKFFDITVKAALVNNSTLSATSIKLGDSITAKGAATGGSGYYNFAVFYKKTADSTWATAQAYKSNTTVTFKPAKATTYDVCVKVKDSAGTEVKKYFTVKVTSAALANNSTVSATSVSLGNAITVKGAATGGTAPYKYAFFYKASTASTWTTKQDFSTTASVSIKFTGTGTKDVCVKVKDNAGTVVKKYFTVKVTNAALTNNSTVSATSVSLGNAITVKCAATGGTSPYKYAVYYKASSSDTWTEKQAFSTTTSTSIKFAGKGTKDVCVKVKDNAGTIVKKYFTITVK